jgi:Cupin domain
MPDRSIGGRSWILGESGKPHSVNSPLRGTCEIAVNGAISTIGAGTIVLIPRNTVHRFRNVGDKTACMLDWSLPGGQDHYFEAMARLGPDDTFTGEKMRRINEGHQTVFLVARPDELP